MAFKSFEFGDPLWYQYRVGNVAVLNIGMFQHTIVISVVLKMLQIVRRTGSNDIVANHNRALLYRPIFLQLQEILQIKILYMVDEDHIVWAILFYLLLQCADCSCVNMTALFCACQGLNVPGDFRIFWAYFDCVDGCLGEQKTEC